MTYQDVRGYWERITYTALTTAGVASNDVSFDNFGETAAPADRSYAIVSLTFGDSILDTVGCEGVERLRGTLSVNVYTPKQEGSKPGEDIGLEVIKAWNTVNNRATVHAPLLQAAARNIEGPITLAPDQRPHHVHVVSCSFMATAA